MKISKGKIEKCQNNYIGKRLKEKCQNILTYSLNDDIIKTSNKV